MGSPKKNLWELIQSLSNSEIQKFKDRSFEYKRGGYTIYIKLFDSIRRQKSEYNEAAIKRKFRGEDWIDNFRQAKKRLYDNILTYIREAHKSDMTELHGLLEELQILLAKRLYHHCPKRISKAKTLASRMEAFAAQKKLIDYERELLKVGNMAEYKEGIEALLAEETIILEGERERYKFKRLYDKLRTVHLLVGQERAEQVVAIEVELAGLEKKIYLSSRSQVYRNQIRFDIAFFKADYRAAIPYADEGIDLYRGNPALFAELVEFNNLVKLIYYASVFRIMINEFEEAEKVFQSMITLAKAPEREPVGSVRITVSASGSVRITVSASLRIVNSI